MARRSKAALPKQEKVRATIYIPVKLIERVKNAVYWTPGLTVASLAEQALMRAVENMENERETPFPRRRSELRPGRPKKVA